MTPTGIVRAFLIACMIHARSARSDDWDGEDPGGWELTCDPHVDGACTMPCNPDNYDCPGEVSELKHHTLIREDGIAITDDLVPLGMGMLSLPQ
jgi:hypothetical protein